MFSRDPGPAAGRRRGKRPLYAVSRNHLEALTAKIGIWQHAAGSEPDPSFGYCTDDVARALIVDVLQSREVGWDVVEATATRSMRFLQEAFDHSTSRFLNFRDAEGTWLDVDASEDCHARALRGLAMLMADRPGTDLADRARQIFVKALPASLKFRAMRPIAAALIGCDLVIAGESVPQAMPAFERLAARLVEMFGEPDSAWPWPKPLVTYENSLVPHGLIVAGRRLGNQLLVARGCAVLDWLIDVQTGDGCVFSPIGNSGWWHRGRERSQFDQQPIEAASMIAAAAAAYEATRRTRYLGAAEIAYGWFLGDNDLGVAVASPATGGCHDGLGPNGVNANQGAESTLMWLGSLEMMRDLRGPAPRGPRRMGPAESSRVAGS